jgi:glucose/arabinose dehydrogenase
MPLPRLVVVLLVIIAALMAACGGPDATGAPSAAPSTAPTERETPAPSPTATDAAPTSTDAAPTEAASASPRPIAAEPPPVALEIVADGLTAPIGIATGPPGWLLVREQDGRVVALETASGASALALNITDRVLGGGERGLLGLALHPDQDRAFVHYSDRDGNTILSEFEVTETGDPVVIDAGTEQVLLRVEQPFANHNGGQLAFGPDGYLWFGLGDGGSGGDPLGHGQNPATLLGSILRLDVSEPRRYAIPPDNPFADGSGGAPEIALFGLRNPWRFSFDRATGELWIADVGQNALEEIDRVDPAADLGGNLGWNLMEASACYVAGCSAEGLILPVAEYGHDQGCAVTGGHVYRGDAIDDLAGWYLFSDYCSGRLFGIRSDEPDTAAGDRAAAPRLLLETGANVTSFGEDADGELYLADPVSGTIYRIVGDGG